MISAGMENRSESNLVPVKKQSLADRDLVMTKVAGLEGTAVIAADSRGKLCGRYPFTCGYRGRFYKYSVRRAGGCYRREVRRRLSLALREGGVFGGLWQLAAENGVGLVADLKRIPVRQETIEVCEYFDLNPYELMAGGSLLILTENGGELVRALETAGVPAAVIGRTTQGNDRIIRHGEESRFLEPANGDEIFRYRAKVSGGDTGKIVKIET